MIVRKAKEVEGKDWGEMVGIGPVGLIIKWIVHNEIGDEKYGHRFAVREFTIDLDKGKTRELPAHQHKYVEALYILEGRVVFKGENMEQEVGPGDVVYTFANEMHSAKAAEGTKGKMKFICVIDCPDGGENCSPTGQGVSVASSPCDGKA